jgi:hypothetical protein
MVETGILPNYEPQDFAMHFKGFPIWLLAMEKSFCKQLVILGFASASVFRQDCKHRKLSMPLVHCASAHLGLSRVHYQLDLAPPLRITVLLSGAVSFLVSAGLTTFGACPSLSMCSSHWSSRTCPKGHGVALRLQHRNFGGPSHFSVLIGIRHLAM